MYNYDSLTHGHWLRSTETQTKIDNIDRSYSWPQNVLIKIIDIKMIKNIL